jgi:hypothetical protein
MAVMFRQGPRRRGYFPSTSHLTTQSSCALLTHYPDCCQAILGSVTVGGDRRSEGSGTSTGGAVSLPHADVAPCCARYS